jgi:hypothetical protein
MLRCHANTSASDTDLPSDAQPRHDSTAPSGSTMRRRRLSFSMSGCSLPRTRNVRSGCARLCVQQQTSKSAGLPMANRKPKPMQPPSDRPACRASERPVAAHVALFALVRRVGHHGRPRGAGAPLSQQPRQGLCDGVQAFHRTAAARRDAASVPEQLGRPTRL